jgi:hypothetical protein
MTASEYREIKLFIYENAMDGKITNEDRDHLLEILESGNSNRTLGEYIKSITNINTEKVKKVESLYGVSIPSDVKKLVSAADKTVFLTNNRRVLSYSEIINADSELNVDFSAKKIVPLVDCGDNDFIVYSGKRKSYGMFNISDETEFKTSDSVVALESVMDIVKDSLRGASFRVNCKIHGTSKYICMEEVNYDIKNGILPYTKEEVKEFEDRVIYISVHDPDSNIARAFQFGNYKIWWYKGYPIWCVGKNNDMCYVMAHNPKDSPQYFH